MACSRLRAVLAIVAVTVVALANPAHAAVLTVGATPPPVDGLDIANLAPRTGSEKLWTDTRAIGQTFRMGSEDAVLDAITLQSAAGSLATKSYTLTIGTVSGTSYSAFATESGIVQSVESVPDDYWTFTLGTPVTLSANTDYGFDLAMNSSTTGWRTGIPYRATTGDLYADGSQFRSQQNGQSTPTIGYIGGDKVFHLNLEPVGGGGVPVVIPVPNGSFEELYKPGTAIPGLVSPGGWTQGVGPDCPIDSGVYEFSDNSTGPVADIPGWVGADRDGWIALGGTYGRDQTTGNLQGSVARQAAAPDGVQYYLSNGGQWGNPAGGLIVSDAPLATVEAGATYTLSMLANGSATPIVLELLAGGVEVTPTSLVDPVLSGEWQEFSRTYDPASLAGFVGQDLTILLGVGRDAAGTQSHFDSVQLTVLRADIIPEPATLSLLGLGALLALRRRRRSR